VIFVGKRLVNIKKMKFICHNHIYLGNNKMDNIDNIDKFTLQTIASYCDADTKVVMRVVCKRYNKTKTIKNIKKKDSQRYKKYKYVMMKQRVDKRFDELPLFFNYTDTELTSIRIDLPEEDFNYDMPEEEFDYANNMFWGSMRVINFPKLITLLRNTNIGEDKIQEIIKISSRFTGELDLPIYKRPN
jgi:hypothetical protein